MGLSSYFFPSSGSSSDLNLKRSTTIESSASSHGHGSSSTRSSTSTLPTSASFSNLLGFDAAKDFLWPEATVFYPPSAQAKTVKEAKEDAGWATDDSVRTRATTTAGLALTRTRSRASSTASSSSSVGGIMARAGFGSSVSLYSSCAEPDGETDTIRGRGRRKSISTPSVKGISFQETVRHHRRSRSATSSDKTTHRVPPASVSSTATGNGFKILSPLPELPNPSTRPTSSNSTHTVTTPTRASFGRSQTSPLERRPADTLVEDAETDEDAERGSSDIFLGSLKFTQGNRSEVSLASSSGSGYGARSASPTKRALQGRRSAAMRTYAGASDASASSTPVRYPSTPPVTVVELVVPAMSPVIPTIELPPLPRSTTTSSFRPKSRRTLSVPFAPHLERPSSTASSAGGTSGAGSSSSSIASASTSHRSPFFDPTSSLKADQPATTVSTIAQPAALSTFSSWSFPSESAAASAGEGPEHRDLVDRHPVLAPLRAYTISAPATAPPVLPSSSSSSQLSPAMPRTTKQSVPSLPSSSAVLGTSPSRRPVAVDRALSQPLLQSRSMAKSLSSSTSSSASASSSGSSAQMMGPPPVPTGVRRATTLSHPTRPTAHQHQSHHSQQHHRSGSRSTSPVVTSPPMGSGAFPASSTSSSYGGSSSSYSSRPSRPQPKLRLPQSYSLVGLKDAAQSADQGPLPYSRSSYAPSSPSGSSDGGGGGQSDASIPWMALNHRRGSQSSQSSLRTEIRQHDRDYEPQQHPSSASASSSTRKTAGEVGQGRPTMWRSASSAVSLTGLLNGLGRKSSLRESTTQKEDTGEDADQTLGQAQGEDSSDEEFVTFKKGL